MARLTLIGCGEAGTAFARAGGWDATAWDIDPEARRTAASLGLEAGRHAAEALSGADLVLSLVTADQALPAAQAYAHMLQAGALWCDMNSVAPDTKRAAARAVEDAGGCYVDAAVLAPVEPGCLAVPILLSGHAAQDAAGALASVGFTNVRVVGDEVGRASAIKLVRSVMVKGIEALTAEMMLAAKQANVADEVLASLDASERSWRWAERADYNLERMATHGERRAAEMEEAAKTIEALGVEPTMTRGTIARQKEAARHPATGRNAA